MNESADMANPGDHDHPSAPIRPTRPPIDGPQDAIQAARHRRVRSRLTRALAPMLAATVVLFAAVIWIRDDRHIEASMNKLSEYVGPIESYVDRFGALPVDYPDADRMAESDFFRYVDPDVIRWANGRDDPVIIAYGKGQGLIARPDGHPVAVAERGRIKIDWMSREQLAAALERQESRAAGSPPS